MNPEKAILVRVGIDASYGCWNAPADPVTCEFVYVPIPEGSSVQAHHQTSYGIVVPALRAFCASRALALDTDLRFPPALRDTNMHLDPDFEHLTYGDNRVGRGSEIAQLGHGDLLLFYAGLRSVADQRLIYALVGMLTVDVVIPVGAVTHDRQHENAHTRRLNPEATEIIVRGIPGVSGRFTRYVPIGEWRDGAYRVRRDLIEDWGGLSVKDGFIQRSARPPRLLDPKRFRQWLDQQHIALLRTNN